MHPSYQLFCQYKNCVQAHDSYELGTLLNSALQKGVRVLVKNIFFAYLLWDIIWEIHNTCRFFFFNKQDKLVVNWSTFFIKGVVFLK